jgi:hypothetical protein
VLRELGRTHVRTGAQWETRIVEALPKELKDSLPTVEQLEAEFSKERNR